MENIQGAGRAVKAHTQERFGERAERYVQSAGHAKGYELDILVALTAPQPDWMALDVATGGGHTALKFAPHVGRMIASDLTGAMLDAARDFVAPQAGNVTYTSADAENLPFAAETFDLVTCRIAPHHFPNCFLSVNEAARVLKPGGVFAVQDLTTPDEDRAGRYLDSFERLRDPSHHRMYAEYEWRGMFLDAGLSVEHAEIVRRPAKLLSWAAAQDSTPETLERLQILLFQAPDAVREWIHPTCVGTDDAGFDHVYILMVGSKSKQ